MGCIDYWLSQSFVIYMIIVFFFIAEKPGLNVTRSDDQKEEPRKSSSVSSASKQRAPSPPLPSTSAAPQSTLQSGTRVCVLQPSAKSTAGFALSGKSPPPYVICQIEKDSPAEKAGLHLNDVLLSINGKSVVDKSYEDTVKLVKEALQQKRVELVVRGPTQEQTKINTQLSVNDRTKSSIGSNNSSNPRNNDSIGEGEPSCQGANAVEEYQST